jgi:hypothetical protein
MVHRLRQAAIHLAVTAMVLRALLPTGWMPNLSGQPGSALIICTMDSGGALSHGHGGLPSKHQPDGRGEHDGCPFAAAPHLAISGAPPAIFESQVAQNLIPGFGNSQAVPAPSGYAPQSPRAPPYFV